jgi:hypothetical protein
LQEDWVLCRVFYRSSTANTRPAAADVEAGSLSSDLISLPMPHAPPYLLAFDHAPAVAVGGFHYQQDAAAAKAELQHQQDHWDEAAYAGRQTAVPSQTWNPFLNSG